MLGYVCLITFVIAQFGCNVGLLYGNDSMVSTLGIVVMGLISIIAVIVLWLGQTQLDYEAKFKCPWVQNANYVLFFFDIFSIKFYILILFTYILKIFVIFC